MIESKNIQVIDGAENCTYDVFKVSHTDFKIIFPADGQDIEFAEDLDDRQGIEGACSRMWSSRIDKKNIDGIHGTLFYGLENKRKYYPTKKDTEMTTGD